MARGEHSLESLHGLELAGGTGETPESCGAIPSSLPSPVLGGDWESN